MKAQSPAFSFYPKDILSDEAVAAMTHEELGIYTRLLCHAWLEGSIPADPGRLARMAKMRRPDFEKLWPAIAPCWKKSEGDPTRLIQGRLETEREKQRAYSMKQSNRAKGKKKPAKPKASTKTASRGSAAVQPETSRIEAGSSLPSPSPSPSPSSTSLPTDTASDPAPPVALEPPAKASRQTWLTGYGDDWRARWGAESEPPWGEMAGTLRAAHGEHGEAVLRGCWRRFLAASERSSWARPARFIQGLGEWMGTAAQPAHGAGKPNGRAARIDAKIAARMRKHAGQQALEIEGKGEA